MAHFFVALRKIFLNVPMSPLQGRYTFRNDCSKSWESLPDFLTSSYFTCAPRIAQQLATAYFIQESALGRGRFGNKFRIVAMLVSSFIPWRSKYAKHLLLLCLQKIYSF
jgi:hypothetical protein